MLAAACGSDTEAVAFGDTTFSRAELDELLDSAFPDTADGNHPTSAVAALLSELVFAEGLADELEIEVTQADLDAAETTLEQQAEAGGVPPIDIDTPEGALRLRVTAIFDQANDWIEERMELVEAEPPEVVCSSHILLETEDEADVVVERLDAGEAFADVAVEASIGPSGPGGGDLGCVDTTTFDPDFIAGAAAVAPAGTTGPVQSQFGWHVIDVRSFGPGTTEVHPELDDAAAEQLAAGALAAAQNEAANALIGEVQTATIDRIGRELELDARYGTWDPDTASVVPPDGVTDPAPAPVPLDGIDG